LHSRITKCIGNTHNIHLIFRKSNNGFSYTIFPVKKINVGKFYKLWENCYLIILSIHILKCEISGCDIFYAHIISSVETIITIFYLQFEKENKLNSKILVNLLRKISVSNKFMNSRIVFEWSTCSFPWSFISFISFAGFSLFLAHLCHSFLLSTFKINH
jgi:hypothetical protein